MSDMKCPICGSKLSVFYGSGEELFSCSNLSCKAGGFYATDNMWQELIRTRKALEIARNGLIDIFGYEGVPEYVVKHIRQVLDQSKNETALEQKDK